ncbi:hypothetical protein [Entomospira culicis]|uniref:Uncharacterized protein n=1 Tax=Entomospira culicis TaxID=2719989 RepID=A0A968GEN7_9SPIO|nr:hypothetical protein [Entomospira culicis]NIZ18908.1 hypothetical protein [Entomospira culicis]NIZ69123.1 hypothetical protein [Entomospira culicis]WDI37709.1 hypothetical protein PVA46_02695 [Entomospira culicis]WDI39337.1 hypothetical protein PVA47_02700 [Entomospira culicis]
MRYLLGYFVSIVFASSLFAQQIFVPLEHDFVLFDLDKMKIVYEFNYKKNPFGVRPAISSDGVYLYYTKRFMNNKSLYQRHIATGQEREILAPQPFHGFRLISDSRILLDNNITLTLDNVTSTALASHALQPLSILHPRNRLGYGEDEYFLPTHGGEILEGYLLIDRQQLLINYYFAGQQRAQGYYQWYLFDLSTARLMILPSLRGSASLSGGGASMNERPAIAYIKRR